MEKNLLQFVADHGGDITEGALVATRTLITTIGHGLFVSKKGYVELLRCVTTVVQAARHKSRVSSRELDAQRARVEDLELNVQLLTVDADKAADLQETFSTNEIELASTNSVLDTKEATLKAKVREID